MKKLLQFFNERQAEIGVSYKTFKKYLTENLEKYDEALKIVDNKERKTYFVTDENKFLEIFKA